MAFLQVAVLCTAILCLLGESDSQILSYAITVRDFLPSVCSLTRTTVGPGEQFTQVPGTSLDPLCPYLDEIKNGKMSGHPDFNRGNSPGSIPGGFYAEHKVSGSNGYLLPSSGGILASEGSTLFESTVREYTEIAGSGLAKPSYCTSNTLAGFGGEVRCGYYEKTLRTGEELKEFSTSNKTYFDMWFNDNIMYNRRVGVSLDLKPVSGGVPDEFAFDSAADAENIFNPALDNFYAPHNHLKFSETLFPDPLQAPNWPKDKILRTCYGTNSALLGLNRLWHTTEIHTFFEYKQNEKFDFSGDDDVWVYINGRLAIDASGVHGVKHQFMDLSRPAAAERFNLTVGETYTFDMFQAERQCSQSNFKLTTTLAAPCNAANELNSKKQFDSSTDLTPEKAKTSRAVVVNADGSFVLTQSGSPHSTSYLWIKEPINVGTGFVIEFDFKVTDLTEGFAFVLHRRPEGLSNLPVSGGANLGFKGLTNSLAIVFDLCRDRSIPGNVCKEQRVSVHTPNSPGKTNNPSDRTLKVRDSVMLSLKDSDVHRVKLDYFFIPPALEVTIDGSLYLRVMPIDPAKIFQSLGAFAGFTASSGDEDDAVVTISNFQVFSVDVESSTTVTVDFPNDVVNFTRKLVLADGEESDGFTIQTRDGCESVINFGGRTANTEGLFVERANPSTGLYHNGSVTPRMITAVIEDDNSGRYKYAIKTKEEGMYSLYVYYGNPGLSCGFDISKTTAFVGGVSIETASVTLQGSSRCFFGSVADAVEMIPLTSAPTESPTKLPDVAPQVDDTANMVGAVGGGAFALCAAIAAVMAVVYRRKWLREKKYIEPGHAYNLDSKTQYNPNDTYATTGRDLLASRAAILRTRALRGNHMADITKLQNDQDELLEQIGNLKKSLQAQSPGVFSRESIPVQSRKHERLEF